MSNILKTIDLTDHAIRRAVFAVFDAAEHRANRKGDGRFSVRDPITPGRSPPPIYVTDCTEVRP